MAVNETDVIKIIPTNETNQDQDTFMSLARAHLTITMFGIIGNSICICVFIQKNLLVRKFNWYLLILAIAEFFFCLIVFANTIVYAIVPEKWLLDLSLVSCFITEYSINSIDAFCVFLTLLLSIDRLKAIIDPINSRLFFTNRFPKRITFSSLLILLALKSPEIILAQRRFIDDPLQLENNMTSCNLSDLTPSILPVCRDCDNNNKEAFIIICGIILPLLLNIIPTIMILIFNVILLIYVTNYKSKALNLLSKKNRKKKQLNIQQKSHHFTIIIMGVWLLITSAPYYTINTIIRISSLNIFQQNKSFQFSENIYVLQAITSLFFNSNHCINILIYVIFHKSFRYNSLKLCLKLFKCNSTTNNSKKNCSYSTTLTQSIAPVATSKLRNSKNNNLYVNIKNNARKSDSSQENLGLPNLNQSNCVSIQSNLEICDLEDKKNETCLAQLFNNLGLRQGSYDVKKTNQLNSKFHNNGIDHFKMKEICNTDTDDGCVGRDIILIDGGRKYDNNCDLLVTDNKSSMLLLSSRK